MELRILQSQVGHFNWANLDEESFIFSLAIMHDGKVVKNGNVEAKLYYSGAVEDEENFTEPLDQMRTTFYSCFQYAIRVWSSTDYRANCLFFAQVYTDNFLEIQKNYTIKTKEKIKEKIESLDRQLMNYRNSLAGQYHLHNPSETIGSVIAREIVKYESWIDQERKKLKEYFQVFNTVLSNEEIERIYQANVLSDVEAKQRVKNYETQIEALKQILTKTLI